MSYLDAPRIHFFGKYFANPSTINDTLSHCDLMPPLDPSWNPNGSAFFDFLDCKVTSAVGVARQGVDPAHMPATRDLSAARRAMIQTWIENGCPEGGSDA
jgi:hypothetical protein